MEFSKKYNREAFLDFLRRNFLPDDFVQVEDSIEFATKTIYSQQATKLGVCKSLDLVVYEIKHSGKDDPRVGLSKEAFRLLSEEWQSRALVLFVPENNANNYRFSLIEIKLEGDSTTPKIHRKYSNPRRYSYLLGEGVGGYTPNKYLAKGVVADEKDLQERFSVEVLTKAFYSELSDWYAWAIDSVEFPGEQNCDTDDKRIEHRSKNVIRLLTRLLFVWFLKQKKLIPWQLFDEEYLSTNLLKDFNPNLKTGLFSEKSQESKYYRAILQNLFFATLNCPITPQSKEDSRERGFRKDDWYGQGFGEDHLMRYKKLFLNPEYFLELVNERVPFLNGGLFDCLDDKQNKIYIDGFSDNLLKPNILKVPDFLFFGEVQGRGQDVSGFYGDKKKSKTDILGLVDILKKYNFTIEENMPFDQEVSLDPELLGKVFENLLASYNPETKTTARKQTGSFYTPREIVQYMVDESLVAHLKRTVGEDLEEEYRKLMQYTDEVILLDDDKRFAIIQSLQNCKVLDPACGSGAFPVGMLQQMVHILSQLDPNNELWKNLILDDTVRELSSTLKDCTTEEREEVQADINRNFDDSVNRPDYARKLYLIENCIYGVDIQSIAVQISKLRFFISLVVDQKPTQDRTDNFGIRPLPNLESKFAAANTLIGLNKERNLFDCGDIDKLQAKLVQASHRIFGAKSNKTKNKYKARVEELQSQIANRLETLGVVGNEDARLMRGWKMFNQNISSPFFDPEWMFGISCGFDIVIGNPPYGYIFDKNMSSKVQAKYKTAEYKIEAYSVFIEAGINLSPKGFVCMITPYTYLSGVYFSKLRTFLNNAKIELLTVLGKKVFESAEVDTCIILIKKESLANTVAVLDARNIIDREQLSLIRPTRLKKEDILFNYKENIIIGEKAELKLYRKVITLNSDRMSNHLFFYHGLQTRGNSKAITAEKNEHSLSLIQGRDFNIYSFTPEKRYITYLKSNIKSGGDISFHQLDKKIIIRTTADRIVATIDKSKSIALNSINIATTYENSPYALELYLGVLNSKLADFWYKLSIQESAKTFAEVKIIYLQRIPIFTNANEEILVSIVDAVKELLVIGYNKKTLSGKIDLMVYKLYGLTYHEVLTIDPQTPITQQQYEDENK